MILPGDPHDRFASASTDGHIFAPTPARIAAPYAAPSSASTISTGCPVNIGLNLPPKRRSRASAAQANRRYRDVNFLKNGEGIAQAESNAFENRANDVRPRVRRGDPDQRSAGL